MAHIWDHSVPTAPVGLLRIARDAGLRSDRCLGLRKSSANAGEPQPDVASQQASTKLSYRWPYGLSLSLGVDQEGPIPCGLSGGFRSRDLGPVHNPFATWTFHLDEFPAIHAVVRRRLLCNPLAITCWVWTLTAPTNVLRIGPASSSAYQT